MKFLRDQITVKVRLLTSCCPECSDIKEIEFVPAQLAAYRKDTATYDQATRERTRWEQQHPAQCRARSVSALRLVQV